MNSGLTAVATVLAVLVICMGTMRAAEFAAETGQSAGDVPRPLSFLAFD